MRGIALMAVGYAVAGRLALTLAIPPGYATAVWPAAGVALAGILLGGWRLWPGVLIGSFLVNVSTSWDGSSLAGVVHSLALALGIAGGAAAEALAGAWLIRRTIGFGNIFNQEVDVVRLLLLGGPVSCVISAGVGVTALWLAGLIPAPNFLFNLWTWWVGDSIGVVIFMPLICAWSLRPQRQWLRRQVILTVPLAVMFALVVVLFFFVSSREQSRLNAEFERNAQRIASEFQSHLDNDLTILRAVALFFESSGDVSRDGFRHFVGPQLQVHPDIRALDWVRRVPAVQRAAYEEMMKAEGVPGYRIWERAGGEGRHVVAPERPEYFPITYIEPVQNNASALGFDILSEPIRRAALEQAVARDTISASGRVRLVQDQTGEWGFLVVLPVHQQAVHGPADAPPPGAVLGVCLAVFRVADQAQAAIAAARDSGLLLQLADTTGGRNDVLLEADKASGSGRIAMSLALPVHVAQRTWTLQFSLPNDYLVAHRSWQAWGLLAVGLAVTGMLGVLILVLVGRQTKVEELVGKQTQALAGYARELERSNAELEQFAYVASHDLQAPLRSIVGFGQLLQKDYHGRLDADADTYIGFMVKSANQMQELIRGLLTFSRIGRDKGGEEVADCAAVLAEVEARLQSQLRESGAALTHDPLPRVACPPLELGQLLQNLIGNALKFQAPGKVPQVHVGAVRDGAQWRLSVRDNGIGIEARYLERVFQMFQRLHTADKYEGTGIGLAICRKIVERHGGRLWVESVPGQGSTFFFTLAAVPG